MTLSVLRYLLRSLGRATPFGLFAGVAPVRVGGHAHVVWGSCHRMPVRADTLWLDDVIERLETSQGLLPELDVVACDLVVDRGDRIEVPRGPGRVSVRNTAVVRLVRDAAVMPVRASVLAERIAEAFPSVEDSAISDTLRTLVRHGVLVTSLRAPMTVADPLGHAIGTLRDIAARRTEVRVGPAIQELRGVQEVIDAHNAFADDPAGRARARAAATEQMRRLSSAGRATLAGDLYLDCDVAVPAELGAEMAQAVAALVRLTRQPRPDHEVPHRSRTGSPIGFPWKGTGSRAKRQNLYSGVQGAGRQAGNR